MQKTPRDVMPLQYTLLVPSFGASVPLSPHIHSLTPGGAPLELAHKTDVVVFDKTGTLTQGKCSVRQVLLLQDDEPPLDAEATGHPPLPTLSFRRRWGEVRTLALLAAVEAGSEHPLAKAVVLHAAEQLQLQLVPSAEAVAATAPPTSPQQAAAVPQWLLGRVEEQEAVPGRGLRCHWTEAEAAAATTDSPGAIPTAAAGPGLQTVVVGNLQWMADNGVAVSDAARAGVEALELQGCTTVVAAVDGLAVAVVGVADKVRLIRHLAIGCPHGCSSLIAVGKYIPSAAIVLCCYCPLLLLKSLC